MRRSRLIWAAGKPDGTLCNEKIVLIYLIDSTTPLNHCTPLVLKEHMEFHRKRLKLSNFTITELAQRKIRIILFNSSTISLILRLSNTITLKWQATAMKDVPDIYQACFTGDRSIRNGSIPYVDSPATILEETEYVKAQLYDDNSYHLPQKQKRATASQKPIYQGENISLFNVGNGVAAMKINSFMPQKYGLDTNDDLKSEPQFLFDLQRSLVLANQLNLGQLILDFR